jgi:hypothetical protein
MLTDFVISKELFRLARVILGKIAVGLELAYLADDWFCWLPELLGNIFEMGVVVGTEAFKGEVVSGAVTGGDVLVKFNNAVLEELPK